MKIRNILALSALALASNAMHAADALAPRVENNYIRVGSNFGTCGVIFIQQKAQDNLPTTEQFSTISLRSVLYDGSGSERGVTGETSNIPAQGLRQQYSWAGMGDAHYRIYVFAKTPAGREVLLNPSNYVTFDVPAHNQVFCVGQQASIEPLNMRAK